MKNKTKLAIINDYVQIRLIENFSNNNFSNLISKTESEKIKTLQELSSHLRNKFEQIINIMNLNDDSFVLLSTQLNLNNAQFNCVEPNNLTKTIDFASQKLNLIQNNLKKNILNI